MRKFYDKNGQGILDGDCIKNINDKYPIQKVEKIQGVLWFGAFGSYIGDLNSDWCEMNNKYQFDVFWEIV